MRSNIWTLLTRENAADEGWDDLDEDEIECLRLRVMDMAPPSVSVRLADNINQEPEEDEGPLWEEA